MFANHGLSACSVLRICIIGCGKRFLSQVEIPVSTPSIMTHGQGLSLLIALIWIGCLVRRWVIDMAYGWRSMAEWPLHVRRMQFPAGSMWLWRCEAPLRKMITYPSVWDYEWVTGSKACISKVIPSKGDPQVRCMCIDEKSGIRGCAIGAIKKILKPKVEWTAS
jgi:hypothetical protein